MQCRGTVTVAWFSALWKPYWSNIVCDMQAMLPLCAEIDQKPEHGAERSLVAAAGVV